MAYLCNLVYISLIMSKTDNLHILGFMNISFFTDFSWSLILYSLFKDFIYLFLERGEGRNIEWERNINVWLPLTRPSVGTRPTTQACALTGNQTGEPLVHTCAQSTELHQPGMILYPFVSFLNLTICYLYNRCNNSLLIT